MLIESLFKRPHAPVSLGTREYFFRPLDNNPQSPHVCEVDDPEHIERLLSITEGYKAATPPVALTRQPAPVEITSPPPSLPQTPAIALSPVDLTPEQDERAAALRASTVADLRSIITTVEDLAVLQAVLAAEQASTTPAPRTSVVTLIQSRIAALTP
jgi:hypothetical protein